MLTRNLISFSFDAGRLFVLVVLGKIVTKFSERDDFADRRISGRRDFDQIESAALRFAQGVGQFHDAELLAARSHNDPDFASANPAVYTNLWLQINFISWPAKRECAISPVFLSSQNRHPLSQNVDALSLGAAARTAPTCSRHIREPKGSCRQHFGAGKVNLN